MPTQLPRRQHLPLPGRALVGPSACNAEERIRVHFSRAVMVFTLGIVSAVLCWPDDVKADEPQLEEVLVIGRRDIADQRIGSLSAENLQTSSQVSMHRTVGDWIEQVPGVSLNGQGGLLQAYSIRGFSRARIRTELNGVPIITDRRAGNSVSFLPPDLVDKVLVEKAASSTLYGSGAMGGVVSVKTPSVAKPSLSVQGQSNDQQFGITALSGWGDRRSVGVSVRRADEAETPDGLPLNSSFEQMAAFVSGETSLAGLDVSYSWVPSYGRNIGKSNRQFPEARRSSYPEEKHSVAQMELRNNRAWLLRVYHHFQDWETSVLRVGDRRNLTTYQGHTLGGLFHAPTSALGGEGAWGLEWVGRRDVSIKDREFDAREQLLTAQALVDADEDNLGVFLDQRWVLGDLRLGGGLRYDYVRQSGTGEDDGDDQFSGSLTANYMLSSRWVLQGELSSGFRFPSVSERYFSGTTPRGEVLGNTALNPETRRNVELALHYETPDSPLSATISAYHSDLQDYIERFSLSEELITFRNLDDASIQGVEFDMRLQAGLFAHRFSYQWQQGEDDAGITLADLNPATFRYFVSWESDRTAVLSDFSYRRSRSESGPGEMPLESALIWNARLRQRWSSRWDTELFVTNILDESYRSTADDLAPLQPGRILGFRVEWRRG